MQSYDYLNILIINIFMTDSKNFKNTKLYNLFKSANIIYIYFLFIIIAFLIILIIILFFCS